MNKRQKPHRNCVALARGLDKEMGMSGFECKAFKGESVLVRQIFPTVSLVFLLCIQCSHRCQRVCKRRLYLPVS